MHDVTAAVQRIITRAKKKRKKKKGHWHKRLPETNTQKILIQEVIIIKIAIWPLTMTYVINVKRWAQDICRAYESLNSYVMPAEGLILYSHLLMVVKWMNLANKLQQNLGYGPKAFAKEIWSGYYRHQQGMISCSIVPMQKVEAIAKIYYSAKSWFDLWPYEVCMMSHKDNHWDNISWSITEKTWFDPWTWP